MTMSFDNRNKSIQMPKPAVDPNDAQLILDAMSSEAGTPLKARREMLQERFGDTPIPSSIVDAGLALAGDSDYRAIMIRQLTELRGVEMLPWIESLLDSPHLYEAARGAMALLFIDESRSFAEIERLYREYRGRDREAGFYLGHFLSELRQHGTFESVALIDKLIKLP
jgi:hypothetical protein